MGWWERETGSQGKKLLRALTILLHTAFLPTADWLPLHQEINFYSAIREDSDLNLCIRLFTERKL